MESTETSRSVFNFEGRSLPYNSIPYNHVSERAVEVPIGFAFLIDQAGPGRRLLEVGNTLRHYENIASGYVGIYDRRIVDKFEAYDGVDNIDLFEMADDGAYDAIVSISTLEHVGQSEAPDGSYGETDTDTDSDSGTSTSADAGTDTKTDTGVGAGTQTDTEPDAGSAVRAKEIGGRDRFAPLRAIAKVYDLLAPNGKALITVPFGRLTDGRWWLQFSMEYVELLFTETGIPRQAVNLQALRREAMQLYDPNPWQVWRQTDPASMGDVDFGFPYVHANGIAVIGLTKLGPREHVLPSPPAEESGFDFAPPVMIGSAFQNGMHFGAPPDLKTGTITLPGAGPVFFGPYITLAPASYTLEVMLQIDQTDDVSQNNLMFRLHGDGGRDMIHQHPITDNGVVRHAVSFSVDEPKSAFEVTLANLSDQPVSVRVPHLLLRRV